MVLESTFPHTGADRTIWPQYFLWHGIKIFSCRTWIFNHAAIGGRGSRFTFGLFFLVLSVTRRRPPLGQVLVGTLNHENCNRHLPKAFETLIHKNVTHIVFIIVCKDYVNGWEITTVLKIAMDSATRIM